MTLNAKNTVNNIFLFIAKYILLFSQIKDSNGMFPNFK